MSDATNRFYGKIKQANNKHDKELIELFGYFLSIECGNNSFTTKMINGCFEACDLKVPSRTSAYLSEGTKTRPPIYIKVESGYKLHRSRQQIISQELGTNHGITQTSVALRQLEEKFVDGNQKKFFKETIDCFEVGANRASIIMCWLLTIDHIYDLVLKHHLIAFNQKLALVTDKRVKVSVITQKDDFSAIPEGKFVELLKTSGVISNDVRKILDAKLGTRNSCAHPSGVVIKKSKTIDFIEDLIENVIVKYPV